MRLLQEQLGLSLGSRLIRVKLVLKYEDEWRPKAIYESCLQEAVKEPKSMIRAKVVNSRLLLLIKGSKPSKVAERLRNILSLIHMVEQVIGVLEA
ncbi:MAG: hypothetical protein NZ873_00030 [Crenarchaeota archaeon]|nr:hypothetical protein [Thermoproteota archaeon]MDW8033369.1 hypothetical protein [Nitrososphaerota archaeon]